MPRYTKFYSLRVREYHPIFFIFPNKTAQAVLKFRKVINWYYAHGLSFTLHLCAAFPPGANSRLGLCPSFSFAITQEIIVIFFSLHLLRCFNSVGCSYLNWNINAIKKCSFYFIFKFIKLNYKSKKTLNCVCSFYIQLNILVKTQTLVRVIIFQQVQSAFKVSMSRCKTRNTIHLCNSHQLILFRYVLHRYESQDIHCWNYNT